MALPLHYPSTMLSRAIRSSGRFGEYSVVMPLARGGTGTVYLATSSLTNERVALKVLDNQFAGYPELVARLDAEQTFAAAAQHPSLIDIREARRTSDDVPFLVMEYLDGETLGAKAERRDLALPMILAICAQVASALAALHAAGVIHCDVKHENVFVLDQSDAGWPRVKLIDFGVSRTVDEPPADDAAIAGTPWCMAPEQWRGAPVVTSDVYALGCILYDLTTGAPPFDGSLPELMLAHLETRPARPSWLASMPVALERLILRMLAKDAADRPSAAEVAGELAALANTFEAPANETAIELRCAG